MAKETNVEEENALDFLPSFDTDDIPETPDEVEGQFFARIQEVKLIAPTESKQNPTLLLQVKYEGNGDATASDGTTLMDSLPRVPLFYTIPVAEDKGVMIGANKTTDKAEMLLKNLKFLFTGLGYDSVNNQKMAEIVSSKELETKLITFQVKFAENKNDPEKPYKNYNYVKAVKE